MNLHLLQIYAIAKYDLYSSSYLHPSFIFLFFDVSLCRLPISAKKKWARVNDAAANLIKTTNFTGNGIGDVSYHPRAVAATATYWMRCAMDDNRERWRMCK